MESKEQSGCKLFYNTERKSLKLPEYGRNVQKMVDYLRTIEDREKRNEQARAVVKVMEIINPFLCQIDLFRRLLGGISNKIMLAPNLVFCEIIQRNDVVQMLCLERHILRTDVIDHGVPYCRSSIGQK